MRGLFVNLFSIVLETELPERGKSTYGNVRNFTSRQFGSKHLFFKDHIIIIQNP
jgi:hypothetical protein